VRRSSPVDIVSRAINTSNNSVDFVMYSHVIEHFPDPIKALRSGIAWLNPAVTSTS
jgi:hypothetical protein